MSGIQISKKEIEDCEEAVKDFRVNELHQLVGLFKYPKIGKKQELVNRAVTILNNPRYQLQAVQKVREIQTNSRLREAAAMPYAPQSNNGMANLTNNAMHQQQPQQHNAYHHPNMNAGGNMLQPSSIPNAYSNFMNATAAFSLAAYGQHLQGQFQHHLGGYAAAQQQAPPHQLHQSQQQHVIPNMQHSSGGLVKNLRTVELPFYDVKKVILPMTELPSYPVPTRPGEGRFSCHFGVAAEDIPRVTYPESQELPRYEIQLRVFLLETSEEQQDAFPPGSVVRLDDFMVNLPAVIPTNKPNAEQKRYPRPVNLTPYCRPARTRDRPHRLIFEWNGDKRAWAFQILLVHRQNSDILFKRMRQNPQSTRPKERTKEVIIRRLNGADEDDVQMDTLKISLTDPLMKTRMKVPARAVDCTHLQTFDLNNYLMMNEKRPEWKCPVCTKKAYYSKLIIEEYFECMLKEVGPSVEEVELLRDGTWRLVQQNKVVSLDSDEDGADEDGDIMVVKNPAKGEKKKANAEPSAGPPKIEPQKSSTSRPAPIMATVDDDSIICLSSDDDEDEQIANAIAASNIRGGRGGSSSSAAGTPNSNSNSASNNVAQNAHWPNAGLAALLNGHNGSGGSGGSTPAMPPELQMNGHQQQIFRPIIEETAKTQIAKHLALFLQDVYSKNNQLATNCVTNSNNYH